MYIYIFFFHSRLWVHEVMRVFYDRLVDDKDREWLFNTTKVLIKEQFKDSMDNVFEHLANGKQELSGSQSSRALKEVKKKKHIWKDLTIFEKTLKKANMQDFNCFTHFSWSTNE